MCKPNERGPSDTIILYVESGNATFAVEVPDGGRVGVGAGAGAGAGASTGAGVGASTGGDGLKEEFDWLNEGLEGEDFANDIFSEFSPPHIVPTTDSLIQTIIHLIQTLIHLNQIQMHLAQVMFLLQT